MPWYRYEVRTIGNVLNMIVLEVPQEPERRDRCQAMLRSLLLPSSTPPCLAQHAVASKRRMGGEKVKMKQQPKKRAGAARV